MWLATVDDAQRLLHVLLFTVSRAGLVAVAVVYVSTSVVEQDRWCEDEVNKEAVEWMAVCASSVSLRDRFRLLPAIGLALWYGGHIRVNKWRTETERQLYDVSVFGSDHADEEHQAETWRK